MTTTPQRCPRTDPHSPHFHHVDRLVSSCPGWDGPIPERDRVFDGADWTPETLHLSDAAAVVVRLHQARAIQYRAAVALWSELCGQDEADALTFAYQIATASPPVEAVLPPF